MSIKGFLLQVTETPAQSHVDHKHIPISAQQEAWSELWVPGCRKQPLPSLCSPPSQWCSRQHRQAGCVGRLRSRVPAAFPNVSLGAVSHMHTLDLSLTEDVSPLGQLEHPWWWRGRGLCSRKQLLEARGPRTGAVIVKTRGTWLPVGSRYHSAGSEFAVLPLTPIRFLSNMQRALPNQVMVLPARSPSVPPSAVGS